MSQRFTPQQAGKFRLSASGPVDEPVKILVNGFPVAEGTGHVELDTPLGEGDSVIFESAGWSAARVGGGESRLDL